MQIALKELEQLKITTGARVFLKETAKWCKFLSIFGFVGLVLLLLSSFFVSTLFSNMTQVATMPFNLGLAITFIYIFIVALYIVPVYYLYKFSVKMKKALLSKDDETLANSFEMLKSHYKFAGVFTIIMFSICMFVLIAGIMGAVVL